MKLFKSADYIKQANPNREQSYRPEILTAQMGAKSLGGMFGLFLRAPRCPIIFTTLGSR